MELRYVCSKVKKTGWTSSKPSDSIIYARGCPHLTDLLHKVSTYKIKQLHLIDPCTHQKIKFPQQNHTKSWIQLCCCRVWIEVEKTVSVFKIHFYSAAKSATFHCKFIANFDFSIEVNRKNLWQFWGKSVAYFDMLRTKRSTPQVNFRAEQFRSMFMRVV